MKNLLQFSTILFSPHEKHQILVGSMSKIYIYFIDSHVFQSQANTYAFCKKQVLLSPFIFSNFLCFSLIFPIPYNPLRKIYQRIL